MAATTLAKRSQWMNPVAVGRAAYEPTPVEHWANIISHGVFVAPACWFALLLLHAAGTGAGAGADTDASGTDPTSTDHLTNTPAGSVSTGLTVRTVACGVYGAALVLLFTVSTVFHIVCLTGKSSVVRQVLHRADRAMIYLFIASSYTPWLLLKPLPLQSWTIHLRWGIWVLAVIGILYQQMFHEMFKMIDTIFYLIIGVMPSLAVVEMNDDSGLSELKVGGALYLIGVVFFKLDGRLPFAHAIWHLFVVVGSFIHYTAVATHLTHDSHAPFTDRLLLHNLYRDNTQHCHADQPHLCT